MTNPWESDRHERSLGSLNFKPAVPGGPKLLYFTANQLHRQPRFHEGKDLRQKPYALFRTAIKSSPQTRKNP